MNKLDYIKNVLKTLDKELLESKINTPDDKEVMFIEYCVKYVPSMMDDNFKLIDNEFLETLDDLVNYQRYKISKNKNTSKDIEPKKEEVKGVVTEIKPADKKIKSSRVKREVSQEEVDRLMNEGLSEVEAIEEHIALTTNEEKKKIKMVDTSFESPVVDKTKEIKREEVVETIAEEPKQILPVIDEETRKSNLARTIKIKNFYKDSLKLVPFFLKTNNTLEEYIDMLFPYVDANYNITENGYTVPFEEEIREKASLAINSYTYATNLLKAIKEKGINHVDTIYITGYIKSVNEDFKPGNVYYDLALETAKKSFDKLTNNEDKDKLFKAIIKTEIINIELFDSIKEYYEYSKQSEMSDLMNELTTEIPVDKINEAIKESEELPRYVENALDQIKYASKLYENSEVKDNDSLGNILNKLTCALLDLENRLKDFENDYLKEEYKKAEKLRELIKLDKDFHDSLYGIRDKYKTYKEQFEREDGNANRYYAEVFTELAKQINRMFEVIEPNRSTIITREDMILYEQVNGTVAYLKNDLLEKSQKKLGELND